MLSGNSNITVVIAKRSKHAANLESSQLPRLSSRSVAEKSNRSISQTEHQRQQTIDCQHGRLIEAADDAADLVTCHDLRPMDHDL